MYNMEPLDDGEIFTFHNIVSPDNLHYNDEELLSRGHIVRYAWVDMGRA